MALARSRLHKAHAEPEAVREVRGHFGTAGNPYGASLEPELQAIVASARGDTTGGHSSSTAGTALYFPGCATIHEMPEAAAAFLRTLALHGVSGVIVNEVSSACCGLPLLWAGDLSAFAAHARRNATRLADVETVVVQDPACAHALKFRYAELGAPVAPEVWHVSELLADRLGLLAPIAGPSIETEPAAAPGERVAYLDACSLARGLGVIERPRRLVARAAGRIPIELPGLRGREADCCGASGLLPVTAPHAAAAMAESRIQAFRESGATRLVTFSPRCAAHLNRVDPTVHVIDASMLLAKIK
jgi:L-lactate dehydrogenase complex protein LldE